MAAGAGARALRGSLRARGPRRRLPAHPRLGGAAGAGPGPPEGGRLAAQGRRRDPAGPQGRGVVEEPPVRGALPARQAPGRRPAGRDAGDGGHLGGAAHRLRRRPPGPAGVADPRRTTSADHEPRLARLPDRRLAVRDRARRPRRRRCRSSSGSAAKRAATDALLGAGGTLTHHHAVGADHRPWMEREIGPLGVEVLRAVKERLDPQGICNPGVLLPE